jgi:hypothetical protein
MSLKTKFVSGRVPAKLSSPAVSKARKTQDVVASFDAVGSRSECAGPCSARSGRDFSLVQRKHARPVRLPGPLLGWRQRGAPRNREDTGGLCEGTRGDPGALAAEVMQQPFLSRYGLLSG